MTGPIELSLMDRCDECGVRALVRFIKLLATTDTVSELLFCRHHGNSHESVLSEQGFIIFEDVRNTAYADNRTQGQEHS
jgi:hypothetical protein